MTGCGESKISNRDLVLVSPDEAIELLEGKKKLFGLAGSESAAWVDPRTERAFAQGHIPGAISLPFQYVRTRYGKLSDYDTLIVYGDDYNDDLAEGMSKRLLELGISDVRTLRGGLRAWTDAGHELETGAAQP